MGHNNKGQIFTIDFMFSAAIFLTVLIMVMTIWLNVDLHIREVENRRDMHAVSVSVSDSLVRSKGYPPNWNETNVQSIGLAKEEYVLDLRKVLTLVFMNYDTARSSMRLANYHVFMYMTDIDGYNVSTGILRSPVGYYCRTPVQCIIADKLDDSGLVWDMYQGSGSDQSALHNERYYYRADDYGFTPDQMYNFMVNNLSAYKTIIIERPNMQASLVNISGMQGFLENGGVMLFESQGDQGFNMLEYNFSMHTAHLGATTGVITYLGYLLLNVSVGETVNFDQASWRFYHLGGDEELITYVQDQSNPDMCLICEWNYKKGRIFYVQDYQGIIAGDPSRPLPDALNFIGRQIVFGIPPSSSTDVISINRVAVLEGIYRQPVAVHIVVWR